MKAKIKGILNAREFIASYFDINGKNHKFSELINGYLVSIKHLNQKFILPYPENIKIEVNSINIIIYTTILIYDGQNRNERKGKIFIDKNTLEFNALIINGWE
jgi:hypothetical protein